MRSARRPPVLIAASILLIAACSSTADPDADGVGGDTTTAAAPAAPNASTAAPAATDAVGVGDHAAAGSLARWGRGRALLARYDPASRRTAVVTTVEISLYDEDGGAGRVGDDLAEPPGRMAMSGDGRLLAVAGESSGLVSAWDLTTREAIEVADAALGPVAGLAVTADGSAVVASTATSVTRLPLDGSAPTALVESADGLFGPAAMAPDGTWIVVPVGGADDAQIELWRPTGVSTVGLGMVDGVNATYAAASTSGSRVGVVTEMRGDPFQAFLAIWDVTTESLVGTIPLVPGSPWAFGPDDRVLVADGAAMTLWSASGEQLATLESAHEDAIESVAGYGGDGGFIAVMPDGTIDVRDRDGGLLSTIGEPGTTLVDVTVASDGHTVTTVDYFGAVRHWDIGASPSTSGSAPTAADIVGAVGVVNSVAFAPDGSGVALATSSGLVETIDGTGAVIRSFDQPRGNVDSVAFSPDSTEVASAMGERRGPESFDDTVTIFDAGSGGEAAQFGGEAETVAGCAFFRNEVRFSPDGQLMAANSHDFTVSLYDPSDGVILHTFPPHASTVTDLAFSPDGERLVTASDDSTMRVWSVSDHQLLQEYATPPGGYWSMVFAGDGRSLVVSDVVGVVSVIDVETGSVLRTFAGQKNRVAELAISQDGTLVASGGDDNSVELWSTATGELVAQLPGHTAPVLTVAFSADDTQLASGSSDGTVRLWALEGIS